MTFAVKDFHEEIVDMEHNVLNEGEQVLITFKNGWKASVVRGPYTYGGDRGLWELGVFNPEGGLDYENPVTPDDVVGDLSDEKVVEKLSQVSKFTEEIIHEYQVVKRRKDYIAAMEALSRYIRELNAFDERVISELPFDLRMGSRSILRYFGEEEESTE